MKRYYSSFDPENYITPSRLKRLGREKQVDYITNWFSGLYEDPANETPYNGQEGGYQYIWGGPYDAEEEIREEFEGVASENAIQAAIDEVQSDGIYEWAPSTNHPDHNYDHNEYDMEEEIISSMPTIEEIEARLKAGVKAHFGSQSEAKKRDALLEEIRALEFLLDSNGPIHGGIGHNRPPDDLQMTVDIEGSLRSEIENLRDQVQMFAPSIPKTLEISKRIRGFFVWGAKKLEIALDAFMKRIGDLAAVGVAGLIAIGVWEAIWAKTLSVLNLTLSWLNEVTLPF